MTKPRHDHAASSENAHRQNEMPHRRRLHKDWRVWMAVALMLAAVIIYVLTLDDSILPFVLGK